MNVETMTVMTTRPEIRTRYLFFRTALKLSIHPTLGTSGSSSFGVVGLADKSFFWRTINMARTTNIQAKSKPRARGSNKLARLALVKNLASNPPTIPPRIPPIPQKAISLLASLGLNTSLTVNQN
jgi:hypothetical protein